MNAKNKGGHYGSGCLLPIILFFLFLATHVFGQQINMQDADQTAKIVIGSIQPDSIQIITADVNFDGTINILDVICIVGYVYNFYCSNSHCGEIVIINSKKYIIGDVYREKRRKKFTEKE